MSKLFYIIGASGAGKDSLINYCRNRINGDSPIIFAHRYITRPVDSGAENHIYLTEKEFKLRVRHGLFSMYWNSHGLYYGIGLEIDAWLGLNLTVVINGSREYLETAQEKYPEIQPIMIEADNKIIKIRLMSRGREDRTGIEERINRNKQFGLPNNKLIRIHNNTTVDNAGNELLNILLHNKNSDNVPSTIAGTSLG